MLASSPTISTSGSDQISGTRNRMSRPSPGPTVAINVSVVYGPPDVQKKRMKTSANVPIPRRSCCIGATVASLSAPEKLKAVRGNFVDVLGGFSCNRGFGAHGEEGAEEEDGRAPELGVGEAFVENPGGKCHCADGTEELECLGEGDPDLVNGDVIQNVREGDAAYRGNDEDKIDLRPDLKRCGNFSEK